MRIAVVAPRYGAEVGGGAEALARAYASRLAARGHEVTALTTCALDYRTWADHYAEGESWDDGVRVRRFRVPVPRDGDAFDALSARVLTGRETGREVEEAWMDAQGPNAPGLVEHLRTHGRGYDAVVFVPYLYATTVRGLPHVAGRAVLVPALHDEPPLRLGIFDTVVRGARALVFSTPEERDLAERRFGVDPSRCHLVGAGVDPPPAADPGRARTALGLEGDYAVCVGRIDASKGSADLLRHHAAYRRARPRGLDLVMLGRAVMDLPRHEWLVAPGFVDDQVKDDAVAGAVALVAPSPYESLSLVLLEAWSHGVPTVANAASDVLVGQSRRAGGGLWYRDAAEYAACLDVLQARPPLARALGRSGWRFVQGVRWPDVVARLEEALGLEPAPVDDGGAVIAAGPAPAPVPAAAPPGLTAGGGPLVVAVPCGRVAEVAGPGVRVVAVGGPADGAEAVIPGGLDAEDLAAHLAVVDRVVAPDGDPLAEAARAAGVPVSARP